MSVQNPTPSAVPENFTLEEASSMPLVHSNKSQGSTISDRFGSRFFTTFVGVPSLESFLEIVEQEDETKWLDLKLRLISNTCVGLSCLTLILVFVVPNLLKPESPGTAFQRVSDLICGLCATLYVASSSALVRFLNTVQPQFAKEIRSSTFKLTATAMLLAMPPLSLAMCIAIFCIGTVRATWLLMPTPF